MPVLNDIPHASLFLRLIQDSPDDDAFNFRVIYKKPRVVGKHTYNARNIYNKTFSQICRRLIEYNVNKHGVFVVINDGGGKNENIERIRAVFIDLDGASLPKTWELEPTVVVNTSPNKYHVYWAVCDFPPERFTDTQRALAKKYSGDMAIGNLARVMRVPGFFHWKKETPFLSNIIQHDKTKIYSCDDIWQEMKLKKTNARKINVEPLILDDDGLPLGKDDERCLIRAYIRTIKPKQYSEMFAILCVVYNAFGQSGYKVISDWESGHHTDGEPFTEAEVDKAWNAICTGGQQYNYTMGTFILFSNRDNYIGQLPKINTREVK